MLNEGKFQLMIFGAKGSNETTVQTGKACVKESTEEYSLGITVDHWWRQGKALLGRLCWRRHCWGEAGTAPQSEASNSPSEEILGSCRRKFRKMMDGNCIS